MVLADVVGAPFEKRHREGQLQGVANERQIALVDLILQRLRPGGDDHLAAGEQGWYEIGKGLPRARAGFREQLAALSDGLRDSLCHRELLVTEAVRGKLASERSLRGENAFELSGHAAIHDHSGADRRLHRSPRPWGHLAAFCFGFEPVFGAALAGASALARICLICSVKSAYGRTTRCL